MGWIVLLILTLLTGGLLWRFGKLPRGGLELAGAALLFGIAGYALQGMPGYRGEPRKVQAEEIEIDEDALASRDEMGERFGNARDWLVFADAVNRAGRHRDAVTYLNNGIEEHPNNPDLWVGLGNSLVLHSGGIITPAAQFAFQRAADISPEHPAPPFFFGLALAQSGQIDQARSIWTELLERSPEDATWRADLESRLATLDRMQPPVAPEAGPEGS